jgi:RNase P/RNase MRP subunit POP5
MVKADRGRRRYVAVETLDGLPASQEDYVQSIMLEAGRRGLRTTKLIQSTGPRGIVRCNEPELERLIDLINGTPARPSVRSFHTLRTSGTLRTLRERYFPELAGGRGGNLR